MTIEEWEIALVEHLRDCREPQVLGRVWGPILKSRGEDATPGQVFGADHPAIVALNNLRQRDVLVLVTATDWTLFGLDLVATKAVADRVWPEKRRAKRKGGAA